MKDYSGRQPNQEQLEDVVCKSDPKPGFSFVLDNFAELLDDTFLQNLTSRICEGKLPGYYWFCPLIDVLYKLLINLLSFSSPDKKCPDYKCPSKSFLLPCP